MSGFSCSIETAGYRGRPVLHDLTFGPVPNGALVAVIGPNAAGKSTFLKAIAGLCRAKGPILLDDTDLSAAPVGSRLRAIAYLPQSLPQPTSLVAYEAVLTAVRATRFDLDRQAAETAVERVFTELGIRRLALRPLSQMSGGQRQMIGLAQIMVREPRLMLLDEPTSALDLHWQIDVISAVRAMANRNGSVCLMAVHDINLAIQSCDFVLALADGGMVAAGPPSEVLNPDVLLRLYGVEARVEHCSRGKPFVLIDGAAHPPIN